MKMSNLNPKLRSRTNGIMVLLVKKGVNPMVVQRAATRKRTVAVEAAATSYSQEHGSITAHVTGKPAGSDSKGCHCKDEREFSWA